MKLIKEIAEMQEKTVYKQVHPHLDILQETVAPRKHLKLRHYPENSQIGILEGLEFCSSTQPQLFTLNLNVIEHLNMYQELMPICDGEDKPSQQPQPQQQQQQQQTQTKNFSENIQLRKTSLNTLSSFYHLVEQREQIFATLHRALTSHTNEIQEYAFECLKKYLQSTELYIRQLSAEQAASLTNIKPILTIAGDHLRDYLQAITENKIINLNAIQHLTYITRLYPTILNEKFSEYLLKHLRVWLDTCVTAYNQQKPNIQNELKTCSAIISLFAELQSTPSKMLETFIQLILKCERAFMLEINESLFRKPLAQFLRRFPQDTLNYFFKAERLKDIYLFKFLLFLIRTEPTFLNLFKNDTQRLLGLVQISEDNSLFPCKNELQFLCIYTTYKIIKVDENWLNEQKQLVGHFLRNIWCNQSYLDYHSNFIQIDYLYRKECLYLIKILLKYHELNKDNEIEILFQLMTHFQYKTTHMQSEYLKIYIKDVVIKTYSCEWKRKAFFKFVDIFNQPEQTSMVHDNMELSYNQTLKSIILQYVILPCIQHCFENSQHVDLIMGHGSLGIFVFIFSGFKNVLRA
jgi:hypothetical protein